jgi:hypothetical protein
MPDRLRTWTSWITTASVTPSLQVILSEVGADVYSTIAKLRADMDAMQQRIQITSGNSASEIADRLFKGRRTDRAVGKVAANIIAEQQARVDGDEALAESILLLDTVSSENAAAILAEQTARATADSALASDITALSADVGANSAAISAEATTRATADSANAASITAVNADYNGRFASGLMQFQARSAPSGVDARFAVMLRAGTGDLYKEAGFYLDLKTVGGIQKSTFGVLADQFAVINPSDGTSVAPLVFTGGVLYAQNLKVDFANIENVVIGSAQIGDGAITNAAIADLTVDAGKIAFRAIWDDYILTGSVSNADALSWTTVATVTLNNPNGTFIFVDYEISQDGGRNGGGFSAGLTTRLRRVTGDTVIATISGFIYDGPGSVKRSAKSLILDNAPTGEVTYVVEYLASGDTLNFPVKSVACNIKFLWGKR